MNDRGGVTVPPCAGEDVVVRVIWEREGGGLRGEVVVHNVGDHACRLGGKPSVSPLAADGTAIAAQSPTRIGTSTLFGRVMGLVAMTVLCATVGVFVAVAVRVGVLVTVAVLVGVGVKLVQ